MLLTGENFSLAKKAKNLVLFDKKLLILYKKEKTYCYGILKPEFVGKLHEESRKEKFCEDYNSIFNDLYITKDYIKSNTQKNIDNFILYGREVKYNDLLFQVLHLMEGMILISHEELFASLNQRDLLKNSNRPIRDLIGDENRPLNRFNDLFFFSGFEFKNYQKSKCIIINFSILNLI